MPKARDDDLCEYELERIAKINRNLDFLEQLGIEVDRSAYFPKKPSKRKVESDSSSDEEWRPGKDEYNRKRFKPFKPVFKPMKSGHTITKQNSKIGASECKPNHEPQSCTGQSQASTSQAQVSTIHPTDDEDFEFLGRLADDDTMFDDLKNVKPAPKRRSIKFKCKRVAAKPTRRSSRQSVRKNYAEEDVPDDDHYIYCDQCDDFYYGECPTHNFKIIKDNGVETEKKAPDAMTSLPENLSVKHSTIAEAGMGVFAKEKLEVNTRFGPYRGVKVLKEDLEEGKNTSYMWEIVQEGKIQYYIDGKDPCQSNWMRFVNCARCEDEQNIIAYQYHGEIYYRVYKDIEVSAELLVWYGDEYAEQLGIPLFEEEEKQEEIFEVGGHTCEHCGRMFTNLNYLETHLRRCPMLVCTKLWKCPHCSRKYSSEDYLNVHVNNDCEKNPQRKYKEKKPCSRSAKQSSHQKLLSGQGHNKSKDGAFRCKVCGKTYEQRCDFQCHVKTHTGEERPFHCLVCGKVFKRQDELKDHERYHTGKRPFQCSYCEKAFKMRHYLNEHVKTHSNERPYPCQYCEKSFAWGSNLKRHEKIHTGERPYQCAQCGKAFVRRDALTVHERSHSNERPYPCQYCEKSFTRRGDLTVHERRHSNQRPYQCQYCEKSFAQRSDWKRHVRTHTGERPFQCQHCSQSFIQSSHLNWHLKKHH